MQAEDKVQFLRVINGLAAIKPGANITTEALEMWWLALKNWSLEEFKEAAAHLLGSCKFMPTPYDFEQLRKSGEDSAGEAFHKAMEIARHCSRYNTEASGDPRIDAAARACGGYFAMGQTETEKLGFLERRFCEHYEAISDRENVREALPDLTGGSKLWNTIKLLRDEKKTN